ncbi:AMP-binding protein [Streptomyces sp. SID13031]|uniref:AMP-binding protein n=1 Tax=Streptomyces sp. SID13031 TaxID=2706046 RepID=UPI0013C59F3D|nr:AMP-binding protein [Streptomyces sp. SID13031]NEA36131.1 AMP-binding protein [Streptomyces sp. SID13031]
MRPADKLRAVQVLRGAGLLDLSHPVLTATSSLAMRRLGPIAGAAHIAARRDPTDLALIDELGELTYGELDQRANALARGWAAAGVEPGQVIGVLCRDHRGFVDSMIACGKLGVRLVLLNTGFSRVQLADVAHREGVSALVHDEEFDDLLSAVPAAVRRFVAWGTSSDLEAMIAANDGGPLKLPKQQAGMVLLTGGTTGTPKGAPRQVRSPLMAAQFLDRVPLRRGDTVFIAAPTFHGTGLTQFIMTLALGSTIVVRRRFDARATLEGVQKHRATALIVVPTMLQRILAAEPERYDTSSLRVIMSAGALLPMDLGNRTMATFGPVLHNLYGSTECAVATVAMPDDWLAAPGTAGRTPVGCQVRLYDDADQLVEQPGTTGRIFVGNGLSFAGYSGGGQKDTIDGLLSTGDLGHLDAGGRLFVDGRDDDMIVSGGENVFPIEVENLVEAMPGVAEVASLGVPDEEFGQRLRLYVVLADGATLDSDTIRNHVRENLARYKVPRDVVFLDELPRTATGKVYRPHLEGKDTA